MQHLQMHAPDVSKGQRECISKGQRESIGLGMRACHPTDRVSAISPSAGGPHPLTGTSTRAAHQQLNVWHQVPDNVHLAGLSDAGHAQEVCSTQDGFHIGRAERYAATIQCAHNGMQVPLLRAYGHLHFSTRALSGFQAHTRGFRPCKGVTRPAKHHRHSLSPRLVMSGAALLTRRQQGGQEETGINSRTHRLCKKVIHHLHRVGRQGVPDLKVLGIKRRKAALEQCAKVRAVGRKLHARDVCWVPSCRVHD